MTFPFKLIDLTHTLEASIPTWNGGCGFNHDLHIDYADCEDEVKFRVMEMSAHSTEVDHQFHFRLITDSTPS